MDNRTRFYCWIIGKLEKRRMTFEEISDEWKESNSNAYGEALSLRTFHRYRDEIRSQFGLGIECDKKDGYRYYIERDNYVNNEITDWMLSTLRLASLGDMLKYHSKVILEQPPRNSEYLDVILGAIDKSYWLRFHYTPMWGDETDMELVPAFVRLFHQRWYIVGIKKDTDVARVLPFDRIDNLEVVCKKHNLPLETARRLAPEEFYADSFGIMKDESIEPMRIRIRAFYPEQYYIDEVPLHSSQRRVKTGENDSYAEYELTVRPSHDFIQELLWHGRKIVVLEPNSLKQDMINILKEMTISYETGKDMVNE
ncbi:MAG: WYL domain-containing protein [Prevotellaceae bacterium]|nr:WYL domain-containing protein [Prevotellaceae bacterium]